MESPTTANQTVAPKRKTLWRYLAAFATLCLLLWSIQAIHHAMQPKYQGKTAEEWFDAIKTTYSERWLPTWKIDEEDPALFALTSMGNDAFPVIQAKFSQKDSRLNKLIVPWINQRFKTQIPIQVVGERHSKIHYTLWRMGSQADSLVPFFLEKLKSTDAKEQRSAILCLRAINTRPEEVIPALIPMLGIEQEDIAVWARFTILRHTNSGAFAAPLLCKAMGSTNRIQQDFAAATLLSYQPTNETLPYLIKYMGDGQSDHRPDVARALALFGTNALAATPALIQYAQTLSDPQESNTVMKIVRIVDPAGVYEKP